MTRLNEMFGELRSNGVSDLSNFIECHPEFVQEAMAATRIVDANEKACVLFGAKKTADLIGPVTRFWPSGHGQIYRRAMEAVFHGEVSYQAETILRSLTGEDMEVLFNTSGHAELRANGTVLLCIIDIRERVRTHKTLQAMRTDLAHAARISMLGEMTASIAHEVRQPLASILNGSEANLRWLNRDAPNIDEVRAQTSLILSNARRAADIIARICSMASRRTPDRLPIDLNAAVEEALGFLDHELERHDIKVTLELTKALPPLPADRVQIQQIIVNMAINAMQAMDQTAGTQRTLMIRTSFGPSDFALTEVEDTGPGISVDHMEELFKSFVTTKPNGLGIGLSVCRSIVEAHGGSIGVSSRAAGTGARFWFTLPM